MSKEFRIGLIALVAGALLYYGFNYLKGTDIFAKTNRYYVEYDNTDGLTEGSAVKTRGVQIGRVSSVVFQPKKGNVLVELSIQENVTLGDSTIAELTADGLLGGKAIIIYRQLNKKNLEPGSMLIPKVDKGLSEMLESAKPITDNLQVTIRLINEILLGMQGSGEKFKSAVGNMDTVLMDIRFILEQNDNKVDHAISEIDTIITDLGKALKPLETTMKNFETLSDSLKSTEFKTTVATTNQLLKNINHTLDSLKNEKGTIGRLMTDDSLYNSLNTVLIDLDKLLIHFRNHPRDFMAPLGRKNKKLEGLIED